VCTLLWRMCLVVTSTMLYPSHLFSFPFRCDHLKVTTYQLYMLFPTNHLLACGSRREHQNFPNFFLIFNTRYSKKGTLSHISCDICLLGGSQLSIAKQDKPKMNTNPKKRTRFPPIEATKFVPSSSSLSLPV
jgi:hypothetical protein